MNKKLTKKHPPPTSPTHTQIKTDDKQCNHGESTLATPLDFHCDGQADAVALMCLRQAPIGGESSWASAAAVHNEMLRRGYYDEGARLKIASTRVFCVLVRLFWGCVRIYIPITNFSFYYLAPPPTKHQSAR
jgi:hypothetical protein